MSYDPVPPRVWSRVQNPCTYINFDTSYNEVYIPLTKQTVSPAQANYETKMFYKGNVLQYKGNSAQLTKSQKYSQLSKMAGPNRTKVFATQSQTYSNPNTTGLLRTGYQTYPYPNQIVGVPNNISGPFQYDETNPNGCSSNSLQDGGNLVCGTYANPCTGEIYISSDKNATICNPASASNVPGSSVLCWNKKIQTFFPRQRYFMNNSTDKWPEGYKELVSSLKPLAPTLYGYNDLNIVTLYWTYTSNSCIPISSFYIYQDDVLIKVVPYVISSITINVPSFDTTYLFHIKSVSYKIESPSSNIVKIVVPPFLAPTLYGSIDINSITLNWINNDSFPITSYKIYQNGTLYQNVSTTTLTISNLPFNTSYTYYVIAIHNGAESPSSNLETFTTPVLLAPTLYGTIDINSITLNWTNNNSFSVSSYNVYQNGILYQNVSTTTLTISNLPFNTSYTYYVIALYNQYQSQSSNIETFTTPVLLAPTLSGTIDINSITLNWTNNNSFSVSSYNVYQNGILYQNVSTTTLTISNLPFNTSYTYYVIALYNQYQSPSSNIETFTTPVLLAPTLSGTIDVNNISLSWVNNNSFSVSSYNVYQNGTLYQTVSSTSLSISGLPFATTYYYNVTAIYNGTESSFSNTETFMTPDLLAPTLAGSNDNDNITLNWTNNNSFPISSYNVYQNGSLYQNVTTTTLNINYLPFGNTYSYYVIAIYNTYESVSSNIETIDIPSLTPPTLTGSSNNNSVSLSWTNTTSGLTLSNYNIYQDNILYQTVSASVTSLTIDNLPIGTSHLYYVTAVCNGTESEDSNTVTFTMPKWMALGTGLVETVTSLCWDNNKNLLIGNGAYPVSIPSGTSPLYGWNGSSYFGIGDRTVMYGNYYVGDVDSNNNIYAGGIVDAYSTPQPALTLWNGTTWTILEIIEVFAISVDSNNNIYIAGFFPGFIAKWDETSLSLDVLGSGLDLAAYCIYIDKDDNVYVGGGFTTAGGIEAYSIAKWNGTTWSSLNFPIEFALIYSIAFDSNNIIYAGGNFESSQYGYFIIKYDGTTWTSVGNTNTNGTVYTVAIDSNNNVYAGGNFTIIGGVQANYIAKWDGTTWSALDTGLNENCLSIIKYPTNNNIYIAGNFTIAGGISANRVVMYGNN